MEIIFAGTGVFVILLISEMLWRLKIVHGESARKLVHISVGVFVAFWPYFMSWRQIQFMSLMLLLAILLSQYANIFRAIHGARKRRAGEIFFALGIGISALLAPPDIIFTAAILHLALADGFAAVIGLRYGMVHKYSIRTFTKTIAGTLTFLFLSTTIVAFTVVVSPQGLTPSTLPLIFGLPIAAALVENFGVNGVDNIIVPLLVIVALTVAGIT